MSLDDNGLIPLFIERVQADPARIFAHFNGAPISFAALGKMSGGFAQNLRRMNIRHGDRVAVMLRNSPAALGTLFGLARAGAVWVPINVQQRGEGLRYIFEHSAPHLVIVEHDLLVTVRDSGADLGQAPIVISGLRDAPNCLDAFLEGDRPFDEPPPAASDAFAISYTSGTTGRPKGVIVCHQMLRLAGEGAALVSAVRDGDVLLVWEPLYHIGGSQLVVLPLIRDVTLAMVDRFSATRFWQQAKEYGASHIHYLGGILQILLKQPQGPLDRSHGVRIAWGGGCPTDVWEPFEERFGVRIRECYGLTEASSITTFNDAGVIGAVGKPMPWFSVDLRDEHDRPVELGQRGEIVVRSSQSNAVFRGYYQNPGATAKALREGALHTGDLGSFDAAGNLIFHGRVTDNVRCKGENVSAWEVEHVAAMHPAIEDCAMIGVSAEIGEQDIKLFVKPKIGVTLDMDKLSAWLGERLAAYQNPRYIAVVKDFERTPSQRIMKHCLPRETTGCWDRFAKAGKNAHD